MSTYFAVKLTSIPSQTFRRSQPKKTCSQNMYSLKIVPKLGLRQGLNLPQKNDLNKLAKGNRSYQSVRKLTFFRNFQELCLLAAVCWQALILSSRESEVIHRPACHQKSAAAGQLGGENCIKLQASYTSSEGGQFYT